MTSASRPGADDARAWIAADFGLRVVDIVEVTGGTDTSAVVWRFVDDGGAAWAAKWTSRPTGTATRLVGSMAAAGLDSTPAVLPAVDGHPRSRRAGGKLAISRWSPGQDAATVGLDLAGWHAYGALLAGVHGHAFPVPPRQRGRRRGIRRRRRRFRAEMRTLDVAAAAPGADVVLGYWLEARGRVRLLEQGTTLVPSRAADPVPCHGDPHLGNVLVEADGGLRLVDWDETVVAPRELDLHLVEFSVLFDPATPEQLAAFRKGYGPVSLDERRLVRFACVRALEDLTSTMTAALAGSGAERDEAMRVFTGILSPSGSASLMEERLRRALDTPAARA